jgi:hypothetical protein
MQQNTTPSSTSQAAMSIDFKRLTPWTKMFVAARIACDIQKLLLVVSAVLLMAIGDAVLHWLPYVPADASGPRWPWILSVGFEQPVLRPVAHLIEIIRPLVQIGQSAGNATWSLLRLTWFLSVWAVFGGAITRMAACKVARDRSIGIPSALRYSIRRFRDYMTAPFMAVSGIGVFWLLCVLAGVFARIPWIGEYLVAVLWLLPLLAGAVMAAILVAFVVAWPFTYVTISTQGSDGFEAFSRSLNYIFSQPWRYVFHWLLALVHGGLIMWVAFFLLGVAVHMTAWAVGSGMGSDGVREIISNGPVIVTPFGTSQMIRGTTENLAVIDGAPAPVSGSARVAGFWLYAVTSIVVSFAISYFWSAATVNYFLIRRVEDGVEFEELFVDTSAEEADIALAGVAASEIPAAERPIRPPTESEQPAESDAVDPVDEGPTVDSGV